MGRTLLFVRLAKVTLLEGGRSPVSLHAQELHANKQPDRCKSMFENGKVIRWSKMENGESGMQLLLPIPPKLPPLESATLDYHPLWPYHFPVAITVFRLPPKSSKFNTQNIYQFYWIDTNTLEIIPSRA